MTEKYHGADPMNDVISDDYRMLQIISRFGITLGFGEQSVAEACAAAEVDTDTFLSVVNFVKDPAHAHVAELSERVRLPELIRYLRNSHSYFVDFRLPGIRRRLLQAMDCSGENRLAFLILKFYDEYAAEVSRHMKYENDVIHPYVDSLLQGRLPAGESFQMLVSSHQAGHSSLEKSIVELKNIIIKYYPGDRNALQMGEVLMDIFMTEEDLFTHCRLEDTLFAECVCQLESHLRLNGSTEEEPVEAATPAAEGLSQREKEIITLVARGCSNKEIAEQLFISVHTVMTHRRNISRKLQIHSPSGLTIYAIVNGLVSLDDV